MTPLVSEDFLAQIGLLGMPEVVINIAFFSLSAPLSEVIILQLKIVVPCPWDCGDFDGNVGVVDFLAVLAQRLVRKVCSKCKAPVEVHPEAFEELGIPEAEGKALTFYKGRGCSQCNNTGYSGRQGLFEVMPITPEIRSMILDRAASDRVKRQAIAQGMLTLRQDALLKLRAGITTAEEVLRETAKDK